MKRFLSQCQLEGFGIAEQQKLQSAKVLVIGAGGLGCPVIQALSAVGIGTLGIVDADVVSLLNLNRQILFGVNDVGQKKVDVAQKKIKELYDDIEVEIYPEFISESNIRSIFKGYDLVIDCTDNFEVRYLVSDVCKEMQLPLIMGAVYEYQAQIFSFTCKKLFGLSDFYRDVFPVMPKPNEVPNCNASGVLGMLTGIVGNIMAFECIQYFVSVIHHNKLINYNLKNSEIFNLTIMPRSFQEHGKEN